MTELDVLDNDDQEQEDAKDVVKEILPETRTIHSFIYTNKFDGLSCSIDGTST